MVAKISGTSDFLAALQGKFGFSVFSRLKAGDKYTAVDLLDAVYAVNSGRGVQDAAKAAGLVAGVLTLEAAKTLWTEQNALNAAAKAGRVATAHFAWAASDKSTQADALAVQAGDEVERVIWARDFRDASQRALAAQAALEVAGAVAGATDKPSAAPKGLDDPPSLHAWTTQQKATVAAGAVLGAGVLWVLLTRNKS